MDQTLTQPAFQHGVLLADPIVHTPSKSWVTIRLGNFGAITLANRSDASGLTYLLARFLDCPATPGTIAEIIAVVRNRFQDVLVRNSGVLLQKQFDALTFTPHMTRFGHLTIAIDGPVETLGHMTSHLPSHL
jgi:hypothetical protein